MSPEKSETLIDKKADSDEIFEKVQKELPEGFELEKFWNVRQLVGEKYLRILVNVDRRVLFKNDDEPECKKSKLSKE